MDNLIFYGYEFASSFVPFLIVFMIFMHTYKQQNENLSKFNYLIRIIFSCYLIGVWHFTSTGTLYDLIHYSIEIKAEQFNLIPFSNNIDIIGYLLNVILLFPLGIFIPMIWKRTDKLVCLTGIGFAVSLLIEVSQLLNNRHPDIDDLLLNTLGAVIGWIIYKLLSQFIKDRFVQNNALIIELLIYIFVLFFGRFLFFNEMGIAKWLYGF